MELSSLVQPLQSAGQSCAWEMHEGAWGLAFLSLRWVGPINWLGEACAAVELLRPTQQFSLLPDENRTKHGCLTTRWCGPIPNSYSLIYLFICCDPLRRLELCMDDPTPVKGCKKGGKKRLESDRICQEMGQKLITAKQAVKVRDFPHWNRLTALSGGALVACTAAYNGRIPSGGMSTYKAACFEMRNTVKAAQRQFQDKMEADFSGGDPVKVCKCPLSFAHREKWCRDDAITNLPAFHPLPSGWREGPAGCHVLWCSCHHDIFPSGLIDHLIKALVFSIRTV